MENMTLAMQNFEKWYKKNVTTLPFKIFHDVLTTKGYAQHYTDDDRLFKAVITTDGDISVLIATFSILDYKKQCKNTFYDIIKCMINNINNGQYSIPTMSSHDIAQFANWVANDDISIDECGLDFDTFTHYVMYEDEFENEIDEIVFSNDEDKKSSKIEEIAEELEISSEKVKELTKRLLDLLNEGDF